MRYAFLILFVFLSACGPSRADMEYDASMCDYSLIIVKSPTVTLEQIDEFKNSCGTLSGGSLKILVLDELATRLNQGKVEVFDDNTVIDNDAINRLRYDGYVKTWDGNKRFSAMITETKGLELDIRGR